MNKVRGVGNRFREEHFRRCSAQFESIVAAPGFDASAMTGIQFANELIEYLRANLKRLLIGSVQDLLTVVATIERRFPEFTNYCAIRPRRNSLRYRLEKENLCKLVEQLFDYDQFSLKTTPHGAYALIREYNQRLCPYCQLHHTNYHLPIGKGRFMMRPPLDHFYPKTKYPYLAISLSNLVPACHQCNSGVKGSKDPLLNRIPHPLDPLQQVSITYSCESALPASRIGSQDDFSIKLTGLDVESREYLEFFKLAERYRWYGAELMDLYQRYQRYLELEPELKQLIRRSEFLLGFPTADAKNRALGPLLQGVIERLP